MSLVFVRVIAPLPTPADHCVAIDEKWQVPGETSHRGTMAYTWEVGFVMIGKTV